MVPLGQLRQPQLGSMSTDLNSEFTHFNLVIRVSKVQQLALLFCTLFRDVLPLRLSLEIIREIHSLPSEAVPNIQKLPFALAAFDMTVALQHAQGSRQAHDFQVWSFSFDGCLVRSNILCT